MTGSCRGRGFEMDYCVQLAFDNINAPEVNGYGVNHIKVAEGLGWYKRSASPSRTAFSPLLSRHGTG